MQANTPFKLSANKLSKNAQYKKFSWVSTLAEHLLGLSTLDKYYQQRQQNLPTQEFLRYSLNTLNIKQPVFATCAGAGGFVYRRRCFRQQTGKRC